MASVISRDDIDFAAYMEETDPRAKMRPASAYRDLVKERFRVGVKHVGAQMPWLKTEDKIRFRKGEVTVWAGVNGSGKSLIQGQVMLGFMRSKRRCAIASFEMKPQTTLERMTRQAAGCEHPTEQFIDQFHDWTDGGLWLYDHQGRIDVRHMLAVCRFAHQELQIEHLAIDSMMKVVRGEDDYNGQKDFVDSLCAIALETGLHIHLVHHMKKGDGSGKPGGKDDIKGSGSITDQVDNVIVIWRNKAKEAASQANKEVDMDSPDALMIVEKQRNGEWEGRIGLYFDKASMQYMGSPSDRPAEFVQRGLRVVA